MILAGAFFSLLMQQPAAQEPQQEPWVVTVRRLDSEARGDQVVYTIEGLDARGGGRTLHADRGELRLDRAAYEAALSRRGGQEAAQQPAPEQGPVPEQAPAPAHTGFLAGEWTGLLLERMGIPAERGVLRLMHLEGNVAADAPGSSLRCAILEYDALTGITEATQADLRMGEVRTANDWPLRLRAASLEEDPDSSLHAYEVGLTTCDRDQPHYELRMRAIHATPIGAPEDHRWTWSPEGGWLAVLGHTLVPVPTPDFSNGESMLGLHSLTALSNSIYGPALQAEFGGAGALSDQSLNYDWRFLPTLSSRRGLPLRGILGLQNESFSANWDLFYLHDQASDVNRLSRFVARDSDERWRARLDNRIELGSNWRLDADLAVTSDPLVDPEFFSDDWRSQDDAQSELYLRNAGEAGFFDTRVVYRLDDVGFTPFPGFPPPGSPAPPTLDSLPRARYDRYSETLVRVPLPGDSELPLDFSWGAEAGSFALRSRDLDVPAGHPPYTTLPTIRSDRARAWAEAAVPFHALGAFLRPGVRASGLAYDEDLSGASASRGFFEAFLETGILLVRDYPSGWQHRVLPEVRLRDLGASGERAGEVPHFDQYDRVHPGQVAEFSLRQFFYAPDTEDPWVDLDLLLPYYPDPDAPLDDGVFPAPRAGSGPAHWGPGELRVVWTPGAYGRTLGPEEGSLHARGLQIETRLRNDFHRGELEEFFTRFSVSPHDRLRYGFDYYKVNDRFSTISAYAEYRISSGWGVLARVPYEFTGNTGRSAELTFRHYAHDFVLELGLRRDEASGLSGFSFAVQPRFLVDTPSGVPPEH